MLSGKANSESHGQDSPYFVGWQEYQKNSYHEVLNPHGIIQMGLAENQLCFDLVEYWLASNPEALGLKSNGESVFKELASFQDYYGFPALKNALVDFMAEVRGKRVKFDPKNLVLAAGATSASEILMFCLAERGDAFLVPTPYYPGFDRDLKWRTEVKIVPIHCSSSSGFEITVTSLKIAYQRALKLGLNVKGIWITNPSNPLGTTMTKNELNQIITFAMSKKIHIVSDEIYSGTVFDHPNFISITEALVDRNLEKNSIWTRTHIVYGLSKDLGLPGFRVGMIYSNNEIVVSTATKMSSFGLVSSQTQFLLSRILSDRKFTKYYMEENRKRLAIRKEMLVSGLEKAGIRCLKSNCGLFCWVDLRHLLDGPNFKAENELWKKILHGVGLNISPGSSFHCSEPGWFRICFANLSKETLDVAMNRIKEFVESTNISSDRSNNIMRIFQEKQMISNGVKGIVALLEMLNVN